MTKEAFIAELTTDLPQPPAYFFHDAMMNKSGYESLKNVLKASTKSLKYEDFV